jgi:hypothetical protein
MVKALRALADGDDEEKAKKAKAALVALGEEKAEDDEKPKKDDDEEKAKAEGDEEESKKDEEKAKAAARGAPSAAAALATENIRLAQENADLKARSLLASRSDLPEATRAWLSQQSAEVINSFLASTAQKTAKRHEKASQAKTGPALLEGREREEMDRGMGIRKAGGAGPELRDDGSFVLHMVRPSDARAAQKGGA